MDLDLAHDEIDHAMETMEVDQRATTFRRRADQLKPGEDGRAEFLTSLAGELGLMGNADGARSAILEAIDDGGPTALNPHCGLLDIELEAGNDERAAEILAYLLVEVRAGRLGITECEWIAESLEDAGRLKEAHRWFTIPLRDIDPGHVDTLPLSCLNGRWRVRRELDLPRDAYDDAHDLLAQVEGLG